MYTIFTKDNCRYCNLAKDWLRMQNIAFEEQSLEDPILRAAFKEKFPDIRSVPVIFDSDGNQTTTWKTNKEI